MPPTRITVPKPPAGPVHPPDGGSPRRPNLVWLASEGPRAAAELAWLQAARPLLAYPPRRVKRWTEADIDPAAEARLAAQMGVSRAPVREAMLQLEREGLLEFGPSGRTRVRQLASEDYDEIVTARIALESMAASLAAPPF